MTNLEDKYSVAIIALFSLIKDISAEKAEVTEAANIIKDFCGEDFDVSINPYSDPVRNYLS